MALEVVRTETGEVVALDALGEATRLYKLLARPMPARTRELQGTKLSYVDVEQVISRLNSVLGADGWEFSITERWYEQDSDCCCVRGILTAHWPSGRATRHEDIGGQVINRRRAEPRQAIEIANDWKGAQSDCLKRCATQIGVGLFLRTKAQHVSEMPSDQPERDHAPSTRGEGDVSKPGVANPAGVAQGRGTGGVESFSERRAATPPAQPAAAQRAAFASDHPHGSHEWLWDQWRALSAIAQAGGVKHADPPGDIDAATLGRWLQKLD